jgi:type I site-specific restriction endonuclease
MGDMSVQSREPPRGVTYEEVWALIRENAREFKEMKEEARQERKKTKLEQKEVTRQIKTLNAEVAQLQKEAALQLKETARQMKETDQRLAKQMQETDQRLAKQMQETDQRLAKRGIDLDRQLGELGLRLGDVVEHIMSPKLHEKFATLNFRFSRSSRNVEIRDQNGRHLTEVDVLLENGDYVIAVEVKTRPSSRDIKDHIKRMEILRTVADGHNDKRKYSGAIAGAVVTPQVLAYALKNGFYVIVPSGETVSIEAPDGFNPRIW